MAFFMYRWRDLPAILGLATLYGLLAKIVLTLFSETGNVTLVWFSGGLGLAALLLKGIRYWPGVFLGAFAAGLMVDDSLRLSFAIATGNTLESVAAAYFLNRNDRFSIELTQPRHFLWLTLIGAACSLISASVGPASLWLAGFIPPPALPTVVLHWWMADAFGILTTTPILLIWQHWPGNWNILKRWPEALLLLGLTLLAGQVVFFDLFRQTVEPFTGSYWMFLFAIWAAIRFGRHGAALVTTIIAIQALLGAVHHVGFFGDDFQKTGLLNFWFYIAVLSWVATTLALTLNHNRLITQGLAESERRLKAILDASPTPLALNDDQQNIVLLNPAFVKTFGYTLADIPSLADWWPKAYPDPAHRQWITQAWAQRLEAAKLTEDLQFEPLELNIRCKNGEIRTAMVSAHPLADAFTNVHLVSLQDITDLQKSSKAIAESNQLLHSILETLPIRVFWKDSNSHYLGCNALFARDAGHATSADLIGKDDNQMNWREQAALYRADDQQVMLSGQGKLDYEEPQTTPDGKLIWLRTSKMPLRDVDRRIIGVLGIYEDITERKAN